MGVCAIVKVVVRECPSQAKLDEYRDRLREALDVKEYCTFRPEAYSHTHYPHDMHVGETEIVLDVDVWWKDKHHRETALCLHWLTTCMPPGTRVYYTTDHTYDEYAAEATPEFLRRLWVDAWLYDPRTGLQRVPQRQLVPG